eukprot:11946802-Ditylum_brightwellii.AAC.1
MWHHHLPCLQTVDVTWKVQVHQKCLCMSDYSISAAVKARDKLWKARDVIIAVSDICKWFMPKCCGVASIDEARIPCNGSCVQAPPPGPHL